MFSIECGKVIRSSELDFIIACNYCLLKFTEIEKFSIHFNHLHLNIDFSDENNKLKFKKPNADLNKRNINSLDVCEIKTEFKEENDEIYDKSNKFNYVDKSTNDFTTITQESKEQGTNENNGKEDSSEEKEILTKPLNSFSPVREWPCKICGTKLIVNRRQKREHLKNHKDSSLECIHNSCKEYFKDKNELNKHLEEYHSSNPNLPFKCSTCKKLFKTKAKLKIHNKRVHLNERRFKCTSCDKRFFENTDRIIHERTHTKETFCVCEVCGQGFKTKGSLRAHRERKHYKELNMPTKEYKCKICAKIFHRKDYLNSHSAMHSTEKKYTCKICSLSFSWSSGLKRHMNVHNNDRDFVCKLCGKDFTSKIRITCHMKSHGLPYINENVYRKSESGHKNCF